MCHKLFESYFDIQEQGMLFYLGKWHGLVESGAVFNFSIQGALEFEMMEAYQRKQQCCIW